MDLDGRHDRWQEVMSYWAVNGLVFFMTRDLVNQEESSVSSDCIDQWVRIDINGRAIRLAELGVVSSTKE